MYLFKVNLCISEQFLLRAFWSFVEHEQLVVIYKDGKDTDFGLHIFESHPAFITEVDHGKRYSHTEGCHAVHLKLFNKHFILVHCELSPFN